MKNHLVNSMTYLAGSGWVKHPTSTAGQPDGSIACDVAVVGGGLGGMTAALRLAEQGLEVVLLEADVCGWGASGRNAGYLTNTLGGFRPVLKRFYAEKYKDLVGFANDSVDFTEQLIGEHSIKCDYDQNGFFTATSTQKEFDALKKANQKTQGVSKHATVKDWRTAGIPRVFHGGTHIHVGGAMNPGKFSLGLREVVMASPVRVFEHTPAQEIVDNGSTVDIRVPTGTIQANRVLLTTNAFMNTLSIAPARLSTPVWVTAVETEKVSSSELDEAGWSSRLPIVTTHLVMESYRTTRRDSIVFTTRKLVQPRGKFGNRQPPQAVVNDLLRGFRHKFPSLSHVAPAQTWGGWIGMTPSNLPVAGTITSRVHYAMACNGHGLGHAPYMGHLMATYMGSGDTHPHLAAHWRKSPRFAPGVVNPVSLKFAWVADRWTDLRNNGKLSSN